MEKFCRNMKSCNSLKADVNDKEAFLFYLRMAKLLERARRIFLQAFPHSAFAPFIMNAPHGNGFFSQIEFAA